MRIKLENVGIAVRDLEAAIAFFTDLGLTVLGRDTVSGEWTDTAVGLDGNHANIAMLQTPDGNGRLETHCCTTGRPQSHRLRRAGVLHVPGADGNDNARDRTYLVLAKPNPILNDIRLRGLAVAGNDAAGRKSPHNHAQTARNLKRSLRNAAAGARLLQADGLDSKSAADVAASLADALEDLHRQDSGAVQTFL